jgi:hypothetical protein
VAASFHLAATTQIHSHEEIFMHRVYRLMILALCLGMLATVGPAQPPQGKPGTPGKAGKIDQALVDSIVARMMAFDKNKDGKLTKDEIIDSRLLRVFERADANKDGVVTREELITLATQMAAEQAEFGGGKGGKGKGPGDFGPGGKKGKGGKGDDFGGPGGKGPPRPGQILSPFVQEALELTGAQKQQLDALQSEVDARLAKILTDSQKERLQEMRERGPGGPKGPKGGKGPKGPPGGPKD